MTVFGVLRGLTFLARDVFEAALYLIPAPGLSGDDVDERAPWWAEELAEREAAVDVTEPMDCGLVGEFAFGTNQYMPLPYLQNPDPCGSDCECPPDCHGSWDEWDDDPIADCHVPNAEDCGLGGDFPPAADDAPTPPDHPSYPQTNESNQANPSPCSSCGGDKTGGAKHLIDCPVGGIIIKPGAIRATVNHGFLSWPQQSLDSDRLDRITTLLEDIRNLLHHNAPAAAHERALRWMFDNK